MAAAYDGSIRINTRIDSGGAKAELNSLSKSLKGFAVAVGAAFGIGEIIKFSKECINLASDLYEVQNVIDTTFGRSVGLVEQFADTAATSFGLSELAAKQYTGTLGAMLKSMGFTESAATDMSIQMASLAGDMASFYNLSTDEAFEKIRSGISGETEPLKQLGINLSVANLEAYALSQGVSTSYNAMSEQNKALLRYNYLLSVTADAQGDFAKTSNSWANQVRILQLQWSSFQATLGGAFIQILTPVLQFLNLLIGRLNAAATVFANFISAITGHSQSVTTAANGAAGAINDLTDATDATGDATTKAGESAKKAGKGLASFDELNTLPTSSSSGSASPAASATATDVAAVTDIASDATDTAVDQMTKKLTGFFSQYQDEIARVKESWNELKGTVSGIWEDLSTQFADVDLAGSGFKLLANFIYAVLEAINLVIAVVGKLFIALNVPAIVQSALEFLSAAFKAVGDAISAITPGVLAFTEKALVPIAEWIGEKIRDALDFFAEQLSKIGDWFSEHEEDFTIILGFLGDVVALLWKIIEPILDSAWDTAKQFLGDIIDLILGLIGVLIDLVAWIIDLPNQFSQAWEAIKIAWGIVATWFNDNVIIPVTGFFGGLWDNIKTGAASAWQGIVDLWGTFSAWVTNSIVSPVINTFSSMESGILKIWTDLWNGIKNIINNYIITGIEGMINALINGLQVLVRELNKLSFKAPAWVTQMSGITSFGFNLTPPKNIKIPRLAQGAVIPPNREFMAILGDQKSGTNIETPLETMIDAFKAAISDMGGVGGDTKVTIEFKGSLSQLGRVLQPVVTAETNRKGVNLIST